MRERYFKNCSAIVFSWYLNVASMPFKVFDGPDRYYLPRTKGQLISKCLFGIFNSPKKRKKKNSALLL